MWHSYGPDMRQCCVTSMDFKSVVRGTVLTYMLTYKISGLDTMPHHLSPKP